MDAICTYIRHQEFTISEVFAATLEKLLAAYMVQQQARLSRQQQADAAIMD